jgi:hypothetical protein
VVLVRVLVLLVVLLPRRLGDHLVERQPHAAPRHGRRRGARARRRLLLMLVLVVGMRMVRERERLRWLLVGVWRRRLGVRVRRRRVGVRVLRHGGGRRLRLRVGRHGGGRRHGGDRLRRRRRLSLGNRGRHGLRRGAAGGSGGGGERRDVLGLHFAQI